MKVYTISPCLLKKASSDDIASQRLILKFFTDSDLGVALDDKNLALDQYATILSSCGSSVVSEWLNLLANARKFEKVSIGSSFRSSDLFLEICSNTFGNKHEMLVGSRQNFRQYNPMSNSSINYNGIEIFLFDTIEALNALENKGGIHINSVSKSSITESGDIHNA